MSQRVEQFKCGRDQAVRLPEAFRFDSEFVYINRDKKTGDVILSQKPKDWSQFLSALAGSKQNWSFDFAGWQE